MPTSLKCRSLILSGIKSTQAIYSIWYNFFSSTSLFLSLSLSKSSPHFDQAFRHAILCNTSDGVNRLAPQFHLSYAALCYKTLERKTTLLWDGNSGSNKKNWYDWSISYPTHIHICTACAAIAKGKETKNFKNVSASLISCLYINNTKNKLRRPTDRRIGCDSCEANEITWIAEICKHRASLWNFECVCSVTIND